jgi:Putative adhesin
MKRKILAGAILGAAFIATAAFPARADEWTKTYTVSGRADLHVTTDDGDVIITSADQKQIDARVVTQGFKLSPGDVHVEETQSGDQVTLHVKMPHFNWSFWGSHSKWVHVELRVPHELDLDVHTGDGNVTSSAIAGHVRIDTGDGHITVSGLKGEIRLHTGDGHIEASGLDGSLDVDTGDGHVRLDGRFDSLNVRTGDGNIEAKVLNGSKVATNWKMHSGDGHINVWLPSDLSAELDAHTGDGHITLDIPVTVSGSLSHSTIHGKLNGGGGALSISSGDGSIHVQRL